MTILGVNEIFQKIIGSRAPGEGYSYGYIMAGIYVSVSMLLIFLSLTTNFVLHINDDFNKAWPSLPLIFGYFSAILVYWHFLFNGGRFHSLLWDLREIVSDRECHFLSQKWFKLNLPTDAHLIYALNRQESVWKRKKCYTWKRKDESIS